MVSIQNKGQQVVLADPFRCPVWALHSRIPHDMTEASCRTELDSMARDGQLVTGIGRALTGHPDFDIEVVCGARRLFVARHLKTPLRVELHDLTDQQAARAIETENVFRKRLSPHEREHWLAKLLQQGLYVSQDAMARDLGITPTQVSRLLKLPELPSVIIDAFSAPHVVLESWGVELHRAWNDPRPRILGDRARVLGCRLPRPPAVSVYQTLPAFRRAATHTGRRRAAHILKSPTGEPLMRLERLRKEVLFRIPEFFLDHDIESAVTEAVLSILTRATLAKHHRGSTRLPEQGNAAPHPL